MYSEYLERYISAFSDIGLTLNDDLRKEIARIAEIEGLNVEEVLKYAEQRFEQAACAENVESENEQTPIVDEEIVVNNIQLKELKGYESQGYDVLEASDHSVGIAVRLVHDYNLNANQWGFQEIVWSEVFLHNHVLYLKRESQTFDDYITNRGEGFDMVEHGYRNGYMEAIVDAIDIVCNPFKYKVESNKTTKKPIVKKTTTPKDEVSLHSTPKIVKPKKLLQTETTKKAKTSKQTQLTVPKSAVSTVRKLIDGYNKKAAKWGYELLTFNAESNTISGKFKPKTSSSGLMSGFKEGWRNGDLEEEWKKILKLCNRMDSYIPTH
jgi:hypothetical protein